MKMKAIIGCLAVMMMSCTMSQAKQQQTVSETFNVSGEFTAIEVSGAYEVNCLPDASKAGTVEITGPENIVSDTQVKIQGNALNIRLKREVKNNHKSTSVTLYYKNDITEIDLNGASVLNIPKAGVASGKTEIECSGASVISVAAVVGSKIDIELSGASGAQIAKAKGNEVDVDCSGASWADIAMIEANEADIDCSGASHAEVVVASEILKLDASGASSIKASGNAAMAKVEASGASTLNIMDLTCQNIYRDVDRSSSIKE